jgi:CRP/FNR family transcriptional regulator, cyclic AMP receptor protein
VTDHPGQARFGRAASLLDAIPAARRTELLAAARLRRFRAGDIVFREGDQGEDFHIIESGHFSLHMALPGGEEAVLRLLGAGDVFGEMALVEDGGWRAATVRAVEPGTTRTVDRRRFKALLDAEPAVGAALLRILAAKIRESDARMLEALYVPAETRVRRRLLDVAALYPAGPDGAVEVPLRQEEIAALAGTSRGTVNRVLRMEEAKGTVELRRGRIRVRAVGALADPDEPRDARVRADPPARSAIRGR